MNYFEMNPVSTVSAQQASDKQQEEKNSEDDVPLRYSTSKTELTAAEKGYIQDFVK